jgi:hypothetical protein
MNYEVLYPNILLQEIVERRQKQKKTQYSLPEGVSGCTISSKAQTVNLVNKPEVVKNAMRLRWLTITRLLEKKNTKKKKLKGCDLSTLPCITIFFIYFYLILMF